MTRNRKVRLGFLGCDHDYSWVQARHVINLKLAEDSVELVAVSEPQEEYRLRLQQMLSLPRAYADWRQMIDQEQLDALVISTDNASHPEVCVACAEGGISTVFDKPMAASYAGALKMYQAAQRTGARIMTDYPHAWYSSFRLAERMIREGWIGDIFEIQYRVCSMGPKEIGCTKPFSDWLFDAARGGGALLDYACYGANLSRWYLDRNPVDVVAVGGTWAKPIPVEDNAVLLLRYDKGYSLARGGWTQQGFQPPDGPFVLGEKGTLVVEHKLQHGTLGFHSWRNMPGTVRVYLQGWSDWLTYTPEPLPVGQRSGIDHLIWCLQHDQPLLVPVDEKTNLEAQAALEAGLISLRENRFVRTDSVMA